MALWQQALPSPACRHSPMQLSTTQICPLPDKSTAALHPCTVAALASVCRGMSAAGGLNIDQGPQDGFFLLERLSRHKAVSQNTTAGRHDAVMCSSRQECCAGKATPCSCSCSLTPWPFFSLAHDHWHIAMPTCHPEAEHNRLKASHLRCRWSA